MEDFISGLEFAKNQYDLFETIQASGVACRVKRNEGYLDNVSNVDVKQLYLGKSMDITTLQSVKYQWNVPSEIEETGEKIEINSILYFFE